MKFLSPGVALYLYKSTIGSFMEYCWYVQAGVPRCYLKLLDNLQNWVFRTVGPSLTASLEPVAHCLNVASSSLFYRYCLGRYSSELAPLVPFPYSLQGLHVIQIDRMIFLSVFLYVTRTSTSTVYFLAQLGSGSLYLLNAFH